MNNYDLNQKRKIYRDAHINEIRKIIVGSFDNKVKEMKENLKIQSIEQFANLSSKYVDSEIFDCIKNGLIFVGGSFFVLLDENEQDETYYGRYELYFKDQNGQYVKSQGKTGNFKTNDLVEADKEELLQSKKMEFEIESPIKK